LPAGKKKGRAVRRLQSFMRRVTNNGTRRAFFLQLDIQGFFFNIDKEILYRIIARRTSDEKLLWLAKTLIFHDCTKDVVIKGKKNLLKAVPPHKTLFNTENKRGIPIGNLTSQFFANVYLNEMDLLAQLLKNSSLLPI
jgi:RNA-directed DNA polymerase